MANNINIELDIILTTSYKKRIFWIQNIFSLSSENRSGSRPAVKIRCQPTFDPLKVNIFLMILIILKVVLVEMMVMMMSDSLWTLTLPLYYKMRHRVFLARLTHNPAEPEYQGNQLILLNLI